jgi:uncharacterized protein
MAGPGARQDRETRRLAPRPGNGIVSFPMGQMLPLFPLRTVLFPGVRLPLHVFEERYRQLVRDLLESRAEKAFGVVAIRAGRETGADGIRALYRTGCTASVREIRELPDGRYNLLTLGARRFTLARVNSARPYLSGDVQLLPEPAGAEPAAALAKAVQHALRSYLDALVQHGKPVSSPELPDDPVALSYLVAGSVIADVPVRQALLEQPDAVRRLAAERTLLTRELAMLRALPSTPAPDLTHSPVPPN